ncbi:MAG: hypothetical protein GX998_06715 [Firmicutes bacterium]|nr:hypothetical protein [Bacillota bacterium]
MRKTVAFGLVICLLFVMASPVWADSGTPLESLRQIEIMLYGKAKVGALIERLDQLENDVFGETKTGPILVRIENLNTYLMSGIGSENSLQLKLNAVEWMVYQEASMGDPLYTRLDRLEGAMYGAAQEGSVIERADNLLKMVWASDKLNIDVVTVPKETLVKIKLLNDLDSSKNKVGDKVRYRVLDDVMIKDRLVIIAGTESVGTVQEVNTAKRLGVDGRLLVDFGTLPAIDGSSVSLIMEEKATEKNKSLELAAGAGMAGVILLGPIGLAGAWFVKGKDVVIPMGTEFYVEVMRDARVSGLSMTPAL